MAAPGKRLKIAQVATIGLTVRWVLLEYMQGLARAGHEVVAVCAPGEWVEEIRAAGFRVETVPMSRELSPLRDVRSLFALRALFRRERFDVVHTQTPKAGLLGPLAARMAGVPCIVHSIFGLLYHDRMPRWRRALFWMPEKWTAFWAHQLLAQSREDIAVAQATWLCPARKMHYIGNGVDVERFAPQARSAERPLGLAANDIAVGSVGRLVYEKGFAELFAAAEILQRRRSDVKFVVIGPKEHDQNDALPDEQIQALENSGLVRFTGWADEVERWYHALDIFVLPSHREGIPRACAEAAACGLPVVATDIRGCRELIKNGETGLLVPVRNAQALADAIERLADDPALRVRMGDAARRHIVANFNHQQVMERMLAFYDEIEGKLHRRTIARAAAVNADSNGD